MSNASKVLKVLKVANKGVKSRIQLEANKHGLHYLDGDLRLSVYCEGYTDNPISYNSVSQLELEASSVELDLVTVNSECGTEFIASELCGKLEYCSLAMDSEYTRYALGGVNWEDSHLVATDGRRMHFVSIGLCEDIHTQDKRARIITKRTIDTLSSLCKQFGDDIVKVYFNQSCIVVSGLHWCLESRLVEGRFPNWRQVIGEVSEYTPCENVLFIRQLREHCKETIKRTKLENKIAKDGLSTKQKKSIDDKTPSVLIDNCKFDANYILNAIDNITEATVKALRKDSQFMIGDCVLMPLTK